MGWGGLACFACPPPLRFLPSVCTHTGNPPPLAFWQTFYIVLNVPTAGSGERTSLCNYYSSSKASRSSSERVRLHTHEHTHGQRHALKLLPLHLFVGVGEEKMSRGVSENGQKMDDEVSTPLP